MIRLGVVGLGRMGTYHARILSRLPTVIFAAIADQNLPTPLPDAVQASMTTHNYADIIDNVDGVIIATPTPTHYSIARTFLKAGKHVLIEKPITTTYEQAVELFELAHTHKCVLHIGHVERFNHALISARPHIQSPFLLQAVRKGPFNPRVAHDSVVLDLMIHDIDIILSLVASPLQSINAEGNSKLSQTTDNACATLRFTNGTVAVLIASRASQLVARSLEITQPDSVLQINYQTQALTLHSVTQQPITTNLPAGYNPLECELNAFIDAIATSTNMHNAPHDLSVLENTLIVATQCQLLHQCPPHHHHASSYAS